MASYERAESVEVGASAQACFDALTDYERIPEWQGPLERCRVLERDERGRGAVVEYAVDAGLRTVTYRPRHRYDEPRSIVSEYAGGDFRDMDGEYRLEDRSERGAYVTFRLRIDPGFRIPGRISRMLEDRVMRRALSDLKRHVEAPG